MASRKSFAYLVRADRPGPQLLVLDSLDKPGVEVPKGAVEEGETFEQTAVREVLEEAGITSVRVIQELGMTWYKGEEQRFFLLEAPDGLPDAFEHTVTGGGADRGFRYAFRWLLVDAALKDQLVQGCGAFVEALIEVLGAE